MEAAVHYGFYYNNDIKKTHLETFTIQMQRSKSDGGSNELQKSLKRNLVMRAKTELYKDQLSKGGSIFLKLELFGSNTQKYLRVLPITVSFVTSPSG